MNRKGINYMLKRKTNFFAWVIRIIDSVRRDSLKYTNCSHDDLNTIGRIVHGFDNTDITGLDCVQCFLGSF